MKKIIILSVIVLFVSMGFQPAFANDDITICKERNQLGNKISIVLE